MYGNNVNGLINEVLASDERKSICVDPARALDPNYRTYKTKFPRAQGDRSLWSSDPFGILLQGNPHCTNKSGSVLEGPYYFIEGNIYTMSYASVAVF